MKHWLCYVMPGQPGWFDPRAPGGGPPAGTKPPPAGPPAPTPPPAQVPQDSPAVRREDVIKEPDLPKDIKPDSPGGQTATIDDKQYYVPGSTMYNLGFRTPAEYSMAQQKGFNMGPHQGAEIPENTVLVKTPVFNPEKGEQSQEYIRVSLNEDKMADPEYQNFIKNALYSGTEKEWREKQQKFSDERYEKEMQVQRGELSQREYDTWLNQELTTYNEWLSTKVQEGTSKNFLLEVGDKLLTKGQYDKLFSLKGQEQYEYAKKLGVYDKDTKFLNIAGMDTVLSGEETAEIEQLRKDDPYLYKVLITEGYVAYQKALDKRAKDITGIEKRQLERETQIEPPSKEAEGAEQFQDMIDKGQIPKGSEYIGTDADGKIQYYSPEQLQEQNTYNEAQDKLKDVKNTDGKYDLTKLAIYAQKNKDYKETMKAAGFDDDTIASVEKRYKLGIRPDEYIADYFASRGWDLPEYLGGKFKMGSLKPSQEQDFKANFTKRLLEARAAYKKDGGNETAIALQGLVKVSEWILPGVTTAYNWKRMSPAERMMSIGLDIANVAAVLTVHKGLGKLGKIASGVNQAEKLAAKSGNYAIRYNRVMTDLMNAMASTKTKPAYTQMLAGKAQTLKGLSINADNAFINKLGTIKNISAKNLKALEVKSNIKGLAKTITEASKARNELKATWVELEKLRGDSALISSGEMAPKYKGLSTTPGESTNRYFKLIERLEKAKTRYNNAVSKSGDILQPRIKPGISPAEFKGYSMKFKKGLDPETKRILDDLNEWLGEKNVKGGKPGSPEWNARNKTITKTVKTPKETAEVKLKPEYGEGKVKPGETPPTPEVKDSGKLVFGRKGFKTETQLSPDEYIQQSGRMTPEQAARLSEDTERVGVDVTAGYHTIREALEWLKNKSKTGVYGKPAGATWEDIKTRLKNATQVKTGTGTATGIKTITGVKPGPGIKSGPIPKSATKTVAKTTIGKATQTTTKTITETTKIPDKTKGGLKGFKDRPENLQTDEDKREFLKGAQGMVARRRGMIQGKPVYLVDFYPYGPKDKLVILGAPPEGTKPAAGPGSMKKSITLIRGIPPSNPIKWNTGAVDDIVYKKGGGVAVTSIKDKGTHKEIEL